MHRKLQDWASAVADASFVLRATPGDAKMLMCRGFALGQMQEFGPAVRDFGAVIKVQPGCAQALLNRGINLEK